MIKSLIYSDKLTTVSLVSWFMEVLCRGRKERRVVVLFTFCFVFIPDNSKY